ncbi:MAG: S8 family peptidase [Candidatus Endonucleobacter sp. (ex Gigantidas childressi)]|nr:S8 family peptidase [Candidatus Endonucleobacter sp. (ex Gigantidas childressi)]
MNNYIKKPLQHNFPSRPSKLGMAIMTVLFSVSSFASNDVPESIAMPSVTLPSCDQLKETHPLEECVSKSFANINIPRLQINNKNDALKKLNNADQSVSSFLESLTLPALTSETFGLAAATILGGAALAVAVGSTGNDSSGNSNGDDSNGDDSNGDDVNGVGDYGGDDDGVNELASSAEYNENKDAYDAVKLSVALKNIELAKTDTHRGFAGDGVTIAIIDSGVDNGHTDLQSNLIEGCEGVVGCDIHYADNDVDAAGHGTHVAGIAAASRNDEGMHGVAFNATILPGCANFGTRCTDSGPVGPAELLLWASDNGAQIANRSLGLPIAVGLKDRTKVATDVTGTEGSAYTQGVMRSSDNLMFGEVGTPTYEEAEQAFEQGVINVVAAGNYNIDDGPTTETGQAGIHTMAPLIYAGTTLGSDLEDQWLAVINVTNDGILAGSSHACGDAKEFCLAAPGSDINSTIIGGGYEDKTGSSMSTPVVSGGLALVMGAFPTLELPDTHAQANICDPGDSDYNADQCLSKAVVNRILTTATDLGTTGVDDTYGRGMMNLDAATQPISTPMVSTPSGVHYNVGDSSLSLSSAMGNALTTTLAAVDFVAVDPYDQAEFVYQGSSLIGNGSQQDSRVNSMEYLDRSIKPESSNISINNGQISFVQTFERTYKSNTEVNKNYRISYKASENSQVNITTSFNPQTDFAMSGISSSELTDLTISSAFNSPYSQFNEDAKGITYQLSFGGGYTFSSGFFKSESAQTQLAESTSLDSESIIMQVNTPVFSDVSGRNYSASLQVGSLNESDSILGTTGSGAWGFSKGSETLITGINLNYQLSNNINLLLSYFYSQTDTENGGGLLNYNNDFNSNSFSIGLLGDIDNFWQYGLFISQPLRLDEGSATLTLPTGMDKHGMTFSEYDIDLAPEGRHLEYEFALSWKTDIVDYMRVNVLRVVDYGSIVGNNDTMILFSAGSKF